MLRLYGIILAIWEFLRNIYVTAFEYLQQAIRFKLFGITLIVGFAFSMVVGILRVIKAVKDAVILYTPTMGEAGTDSILDYMDALVPMTQLCVALALWGGVAAAVSLYTWLKSWMPSVFGITVGATK